MTAAFASAAQAMALYKEGPVAVSQYMRDGGFLPVVELTAAMVYSDVLDRPALGVAIEGIVLRLDDLTTDWLVQKASPVVSRYLRSFTPLLEACAESGQPQVVGAVRFGVRECDGMASYATGITISDSLPASVAPSADAFVQEVGEVLLPLVVRLAMADIHGESLESAMGESGKDGQDT